MSPLKTFILCIFLISATNARAETLFYIDSSFGGDKLADSNIVDFSLYAGQGTQISMGYSHKFTPTTSLEMLLGYKFGILFSENKGFYDDNSLDTITFGRFPLDLGIKIKPLNKHSFGAGFSHHLSPTFKRTGINSVYKNSTGLYATYGYLLTDSLTLGLKATKIDYKAQEKTYGYDVGSLNGDNVAIFFLAAF